MKATDKKMFVALLDALANEAHSNSRNHGFWKDEPASPTRYKLSAIALMHSELSEAVEGIRKGLKDDHLPNRSMEIAELADTVIRILDYAGAYDLPLAAVILEKMAYNKGRPFMHGDKKA